MHTVRLALRIPEGSLHPVHAFVCESPSVRREVVLERDATGETTTLLSRVEGGREAYEAVVEDLPHVEEWATEPAEDGFYVYARFRLPDRERRYYDALHREGTLVVPPVEMRQDRTLRLSLVGDPGGISAAVDDLAGEVPVDVLRTGAYRGVDGTALSDRQREAVRAAWAEGYYELPREGDLAGVADRLDCSTSTASDLLRRAERRLVAGLLDERR